MSGTEICYFILSPSSSDLNWLQKGVMVSCEHHMLSGDPLKVIDCKYDGSSSRLTSLAVFIYV